MVYKAVVIGSSAGGLDALKTLLSSLRKGFRLPILIVQHQSPQSNKFLPKYLDEHCSMKVKEADEKEKILPGMVYIAPPNYHLLVEEDETLSLSVEEKVNYARPSIDVLFESAAYVYHNTLIGIILTGANNDGSNGMKIIKENGGKTIAQDPSTAYVDIMPKAAIATTQIDHILPINKIGELLNILTIKR